VRNEHLKLGKAGELRILSELLLFGLNPFSPMSDEGIDIADEIDELSGLAVILPEQRKRVKDGNAKYDKYLDNWTPITGELKTGEGVKN